MSGGIAQLIAIGAQDAHLVGDPEISFFRSVYKRHTNFSQTIERQVIQGNVQNNGTSVVRFQRKGDLLSHTYFTVEDGTTVLAGKSYLLDDMVKYNGFIYVKVYNRWFVSGWRKY